MMKKIDVTVVGGGMIVHDQILPSLYHLQRLGRIGKIKICAKSSIRLKKLAKEPAFKEGFPNQSFESYPSIDEPPENKYPDLYKKIIEKMEPQNCVFIALPDQMHYQAIKYALEHDQHVITVKPFVMKYSEAEELEKIAYEKGLFIGIEYHKRFDRRSLLAKKYYKAGDFGEFIIGEAKLIEPYYYRHSNFQNWFLPEFTDPFVYIGCHYWDLVYFITGLRPVRVSVEGIKRKFPNGNEGYLWANGRIIYENGAILSITNGLGYPNKGAGSNMQGLEMYFEGKDKTGHLKHNDQMRGVEYSFLENIGPGNSYFNYVNPDYFKLVPFEGDGLKPVGYGYESIEANVNAILSIVNLTNSLNSNVALGNRQVILREIDRKGIIATPSNSKINEIITEAARLSILNEGKNVEIKYDKNKPLIELKN
ncbi:MAG: Gfo/Idh/MocA family protein [Promethearchaeota archaeon]